MMYAQNVLIRPLQLNFKEKVALFKMIIYKEMFMQNWILKYSPFLQISSFSVIHKVFSTIPIARSSIRKAILQLTFAAMKLWRIGVQVKIVLVELNYGASISLKKDQCYEDISSLR